MKRVLVYFLIFMMLFTSTALAVESNEVDDQGECVVVYDNSVQPRYRYIVLMTVGLYIDENGNLDYNGSANVPNRNLRITLTLQRSTNGLFWEDLESYVKRGYDNLGAGGERTVAPGDYFYRAKIITDVYDSNNNIVETATGYSSEERY
ncbi:MAG: hypothetical protein II347_04040 [Lachnospiraceae bacterium]|nr:hypothetical protein [Lachnospiraceae bacterium]